MRENNALLKFMKGCRFPANYLPFALRFKSYDTKFSRKMLRDVPNRNLQGFEIFLLTTDVSKDILTTRVDNHNDEIDNGKPYGSRSL